MYQISPAEFGFRLTFSGAMTAAEMEQWRQESAKFLRAAPKTPWRVYVDMRKLSPLPQDAKDVLIAGQAAYKEAGMDRSVVVGATRIVAMQMRNTALASGIESGERYVSVEEPNWGAEAEAWILRGVEPTHK